MTDIMDTSEKDYDRIIIPRSSSRQASVWPFSSHVLVHAVSLAEIALPHFLFRGRSAGRQRFPEHQQLVFTDDERNADDQCQRVADGLGQKDAVDAPNQREEIDERDEEHDLPQQRDEDGGQGLG